MKVLDLFAGLCGWSKPWKDRGHKTFSLDLAPQFEVDSHANIMDFNPLRDMPWLPDVVLASPPCEGFSVMQIGRNWTPPPDHQPKTDKARLALQLVERTFVVIGMIAPRAFIIENPRAKLRKLPVMEHVERRTVTYCNYHSEDEGPKRMKPTDLWGGFPPSLVLKPACKNGMPCHVSAPRGSRTGTQGMDTALSAKIPYKLALDVVLACERDYA